MLLAGLMPLIGLLAIVLLWNPWWRGPAIRPLAHKHRPPLKLSHSITLDQPRTLLCSSARARLKKPRSVSHCVMSVGVSPG